jgi:DNA-binding LytR/AlgR family response regulator
MQVVIIEDEQFAARRLENMIHEFDPDIQIVAKLESVSESIEWFRNNAVPDLIFLDIHLEDNVSFAIFDSISITCPIVFTTATDELSTRAFALKKIDFLLKPLIQADLVKMIIKYKNLPVAERQTVNASLFNDIIGNQK